MELTAMSDSLFNANVYSVYLTTEEGPGSYHRELCELRRKFFENGKKKQKYNSKSSMLGYPEKIKGRIKKHDLKWKKTAGTVVKEEAFCISKNFVVVIRDLGGSIISKITYNRDMLWIKTEYFRTDNYTTPHTILKPRDTENSIELFTYNFEKARYSSVILYPAPYKADTPEQSIINAKHGDEFVILSSDRGSFCYCPEAEQQARLKTAKEMESGTIMLTTAWEVKDGEVPEPALEPNGDEGAILDIIDAIMNKEVPELEKIPESTEVPATIEIPETEGVTEETGVGEFSDGAVLFSLDMLNTLRSGAMREMTDDFAVIPTPKADMNQTEYRSAMHDNNHLIGLPYTNTRIQATTATLELMAYLSYYNVVPDYINEALKFKYTRDEQAAEMIDLIYASVYTDFGLIWEKWIFGSHWIRAYGVTQSPASLMVKLEETWALNLKETLARLDELSAEQNN